LWKAVWPHGQHVSAAKTHRVNTDAANSFFEMKVVMLPCDRYPREEELRESKGLAGREASVWEMRDESVRRSDQVMDWKSVDLECPDCFAYPEIKKAQDKLLSLFFRRIFIELIANIALYKFRPVFTES